MSKTMRQALATRRGAPAAPPVARALVLAVATLGAPFGATTARAADRPCAPMTVEVDPAVRARWAEVTEQIRRTFASRADVDACARVELTMVDGGVFVGVALPDGRAASRAVSRREDVLPTLEALLLVPQRSLPSTPSATQSSPAAPAPPTSAAPATPQLLGPLSPGAATPASDHDATIGRAPSSPSSRLRIELSVVTDARIGDGQTSYGLGLLSFLETGGWLAGFEGRADRDQGIGGGDAGAALELAALGGRRLRFQNLALDAVVGPALALRGGGATSVGTSGGNASSQSSVGTVPRALVGVRLNFAARSTLRTFVGVDGEVGPARAPGSDPSRDGSSLPTWTFGLAFGGTVGTP